MSKGSKAPTQPTEQTVVNTNLPEYLEPFVTRVAGRAEEVSNMPYEGYDGPRIAGFNQDQAQSMDMIRALPGSFTRGFDQAEGLTGLGAMAAGAGTQRLLEGPRTFGSQQAGFYMNPFTDAVLERARANATRTLGEQRARMKMDPTNSFGSYGDVVGASLLERDFGDRLANTEVDVLNRGFENAQQQFERDRRFGYDLDRSAIDAGKGLSSFGQTFADLSRGRRSMFVDDADALARVGLQNQQQTQASLDLAEQDFLNQRDFARNQTTWLSNIIRGLPSNMSSDTTTYAPKPNPYSQLLGLATGAAGLANAFSPRG